MRSRLPPRRHARRHERCQTFATVPRLDDKRGGTSENCHGVDTSAIRPVVVVRGCSVSAVRSRG